MKRKRTQNVLLLLTFLQTFFFIFAFASSSKNISQKINPSNSALTAMNKKYAEAKTLKINFQQTKKNSATGTEKKSKGTIFIKKPHFFRWETFSPEKDILVTNGVFFWFFTPPFRKNEKGQLLVRKAADVQSKLAIDLLSGSIQFQKDFKILKSKPFFYKMKPLKPSGDVDYIELYLEKTTKLVYKLVLFSVTGNETELNLENPKLNLDLPNDMFTFSKDRDTAPGTEFDTFQE
ncbi:MAG: outer membrane lipoprotein carrier protein LolA [Bacteriovoracia bacterium]